MAVQTTYHDGGFNPSALAKNRKEEMDSVAGTFTSWDAAGAQTSQRALTTAETQLLSAQDAGGTTMTNAAALKTKAAQALTANATYLAIPTPTAAQNAAQAKALTQQVNALIRLLLGSLDDISGT